MNHKISTGMRKHTNTIQLDFIGYFSYINQVKPHSISSTFMTHIIGIGRTKFGVLKQQIPELAYEAMYQAINDSPISIEDIEAIYVSNFCAGLFENQLHLNALISSLLPKSNIPIVRIETACAAASSALYQGIISLERFNNVLVLGVEKMTNADGLSASKNISAAGDKELEQKEGLIFPAQYALMTQQHMLKYGTTKGDLAQVSLKNHQNSRLNELAHFYHKDVDLETIESSLEICSPLRLFDCSPISDGAAAAVISKKRYSKRDIHIAASAMATDSISLAQREDFTTLKAAKIAAMQAYEQAGLGPKDIDIAEVHDCFTIGEILAMEDLGFCKPGEASQWIQEGKTKITGKLPINTDGGLKADGHPIGATGIAEIIELVHQLRAEAGPRQIKNASVGLAHNIGGTGGTAVVHILKK
jgi:acetyl-CoA C-acetyltransferase